MNFSPSAAALRSTLNESGIREPIWNGFQAVAKMGYPFINTIQVSDGAYELRIEQYASGYRWSFKRTVQS